MSWFFYAPFSRANNILQLEVTTRCNHSAARITILRESTLWHPHPVSGWAGWTTIFFPARLGGRSIALMRANKECSPLDNHSEIGFANPYVLRHIVSDRAFTDRKASLVRSESRHELCRSSALDMNPESCGDGATRTCGGPRSRTSRVFH